MLVDGVSLSLVPFRRPLVEQTNKGIEFSETDNVHESVVSFSLLIGV